MTETRWCDLCHKKILTIKEVTDNSIGKFRVCDDCMEFLKVYADLVRKDKI